MKKADFLNQLKEYLSDGEDITPETLLSDLPGWDSIGRLTIIALLSNVDSDLKINVQTVKEYKTAGDIMDTVAHKLED